MGLFSWFGKRRGEGQPKGGRGVVIDIIATDPVTKETVFVLVHSEPWSVDGREWPALQERLNRYVGAALAHAEDHQDEDGALRLPRIVVVSPEAAPRVIVEAVEMADDQVRPVGTRVTIRAKPEFMADFGRPPGGGSGPPGGRGA